MSKTKNASLIFILFIAFVSVIVANNRNEELSYKSGALENPEIVKDVCQILEGGKVAFENRRNKYQMTN